MILRYRSPKSATEPSLSLARRLTRCPSSHGVDYHRSDVGHRSGHHHHCPAAKALARYSVPRRRRAAASTPAPAQQIHAHLTFANEVSSASVRNTCFYGSTRKKHVFLTVRRSSAASADSGLHALGVGSRFGSRRRRSLREPQVLEVSHVFAERLAVLVETHRHQPGCVRALAR